MKKFLATLLFAICLSGIFITAEGREVSAGQPSLTKNSIGLKMLQRHWRHHRHHHRHHRHG